MRTRREGFGVVARSCRGQTTVTKTTEARGRVPHQFSTEPRRRPSSQTSWRAIPWAWPRRRRTRARPAIGGVEEKWARSLQRRSHFRTPRALTLTRPLTSRSRHLLAHPPHVRDGGEHDTVGPRRGRRVRLASQARATDDRHRRSLAVRSRRPRRVAPANRDPRPVHRRSTSSPPSLAARVRAPCPAA